MRCGWKVKWSVFSLILLLLGGALGCAAAEEPSGAQPEVTPRLETFSQWAVSAEASSSFGFPDWGANRATGAPDVPDCSDDSRAWASARGSGVEWLQLTYARPVHATEVRVYQTLGRGAISRIVLITEGGEQDVVWEGTDALEPCPGYLSASFPRTDYRVIAVRVDLDQSRTGFWNEIDAVELIGVLR